MKCYKILDEKDGLPLTLFHGVGGSRTLPLDCWIDASVKAVRDGAGTTYQSGFHALPTLNEAIQYMAKFKNPRVICEVDIDETAGVWPKMHSPSGVILAKRMRISSSQWSQRVVDLVSAAALQRQGC